MKINYVTLVIYLAIIGSIIYVIYDVRHRGSNEFGDYSLTASNKLLIVYILMAFIGYIGIHLTSTGVKKIQQDRKNRTSFHVAEAVFLRSISDTHTDSDGGTTTSYEHIYEYYVNGERYECRNDVSFSKSGVPKKITIRYNPEKPQEVLMSRENILGLVAGILCIGLAVLLIYASTKIEFEGGKSIYGYLKNIIWK